ncbi:uncharacterized protein EAF01_005076 [Botrytis porri]|uniref:Uncharacterized protein n=1 Tax=Botrytis porri TaxID=87229 RepID=A0A4Z1L6G5_9HELO|nr:uncharacterized protein EAF01_005076 [Botrytis porri]KAF7907490.1 hypothetical protein EAF01_005076 [Botrytis porri]TGO92460.1 hypothetical protein BPOR_0002g00070 [Botrytis porri]
MGEDISVGAILDGSDVWDKKRSLSLAIGQEERLEKPHLDTEAALSSQSVLCIKISQWISSSRHVTEQQHEVSIITTE